MYRPRIFFRPSPAWLQRSSILALVAVLALLESGRYFEISIPDPATIYLTVIVYATFAGGVRIGLVGVVLCLLYRFYSFFRTNQEFNLVDVPWGSVGLQFVSCSLTVAMVGSLCQRIKRQGLALRESTARLHNVFANLPVVLSVINREGIFTQVQTGPTLEVQYNLSDLLGQSFRTAVPYQPKMAEYWQRALDGETFRAVVPFPSKAMILEVYFTPLYAQQKQIDGAMALFLDVTEQKRAEEKLKQSEARFRAAAFGSLTAFFIAECVRDEAGQICDFCFVEVNQQGELLVGKPKEEIVGHLLCRTLPVVCADGLFEQYVKVAETGQAWEAIFPLEFPGKGVVWLNQQVVPLLDGLAFISRDITRPKQAEVQLKVSLQEKEVMLKEIHHRVKNNLQIISSLLHLQRSTVQEPEAVAALNECQQRIRSMALIHEKLYSSADLAHIDFTAYLQSLTNQLFRCYHVGRERVGLDIRAGQVQLTIDRAIPCGLIINEVVTNSLKYAFPADYEGKGQITLGLEPCLDCSGYVSLMIADNGVGLPPGIDFDKSETLGMFLIRTLSKQLDGSVDFISSSSAGTCFKLVFKA
jgi:PAS domain S-box-containing protein